MKKYPKVSIIIPLYVISPRFFEDIRKFRDLDYPDYEILVICDRKVELKEANVRLILTRKKNTGPAEKRDFALKYATGEICAFIDDDAYPEKDWLKNAVGHFKDEKVAGVGGPGITPREDPYWAQLTGLVYSSFFCGGFARHRFVKEKSRYIEDFPAYNLLIRKKVMEKVGGYGSSFYGGEDTFLCLKIIDKGYKLFYDSKVVVYHHRRELFLPYLSQIFNVGIHRGYFAKHFPRTSRRVSYFTPSLLTLGLFVFFLSALTRQALWPEMFLLLVLFILIGAFSVIRYTNTLNALIVGIAIIFTHISYGIGFIKGLMTKKLTR